MSDDFLPQMFVPFAREERSRSKATASLGLGMMFVQKVVVAHNGSVVVLHNKPSGLTVQMELPLTTSADFQW